MDDDWQLAHIAAAAGRPSVARQHLDALITSTPTAHHLSRAIHAINRHAVHTPPPPPTLPLPSLRPSAPLALHLFCEEAALTALHNASLAVLRAARTPRLAHALIHRFTRVAQLLAVAQPLSNINHIDRVIALVDVIAPALPTTTDRPTTEAAVRWAHIAVENIDLLAASAILSQQIPSALSASRAADVLRSAISRLLPPGLSPSTIPSSSRSARITATALRQAGDLSAALSLLGSQPSSGPEALLAAGLHILLGDDTSARHCANIAAATGHRPADALALAARASRGENAVATWRAALAVEPMRPAALWMAARAMGRAGWHERAAEALKLALLAADQVETDLQTCPVGVVRMGTATLDCAAVRAERAAALFAAGDEHEANETLANGAVGDVPGGLAWAAAMRGRNTKWIGRWTYVGNALGCAERALRNGSAKEAADVVQDGLREGALAGARGGAEAVVRGVAFQNVGVARLCAGMDGVDAWLAAAQTALEKASGDVDGEEVTRLAGLAAFARCVAMWATGRKLDAAELWIAARGLNIEDVADVMEMASVGDGEGEGEGKMSKKSGPKQTEVMNEVSDEILRRMDALSARFLRSNATSRDTTS